MKIFLPEFLPAPKEGGFRMEGYWVWCGSVIRGDDGKYYMFASRWRNTLPMHPGWLLESEIVRAVCDTPNGEFKFLDVVLKSRGAEYWDGRATHNPHIKKHDGKYILYYTGTTHPFTDVENDVALDDYRVISARSNKRIGIAICDSVTGEFERFDKPILECKPNTFYSFLTSNAAPHINEDGSVLMVFKSRKYEGNMHGQMMLGVAKADHYLGEYKVINTEPIFDTKGGEVQLEDPFIWKQDGQYCLIAKDMSGKVCGEKHGGVVAFSKDGLQWELQYSKKSYSREILWDNGEIITMGSLERPFILFEDGKPINLFFATADGVGGFTNASKTWNMTIPVK